MLRTEETKTKTREYKETVFIADDGTRFVARNYGDTDRSTDERIAQAEKECRKYEDSCEFVMNLKFKNFARKLTKYAHNAMDCLIGGGNGEAKYYYVTPKNSDDIFTLLAYMKAVGDAVPDDSTYKYSMKIGMDLIEAGKDYILAYWPDSPWMNLFEVERFKKYFADAMLSAKNGEDLGMFEPEEKKE